MKIELVNNISLAEIPDNLSRKIRDTFTLENPVWLDNKKMNRWNGKTDHYLYFYEQTQAGLSLPRGTLGLILYFCKGMHIQARVEDHRRTLPQVDFAFNGTLKAYQKKAVQDILSRDSGVLQAPTGSGKTVMALGGISARKQPTLIIVHTKELLNQWRDRIETFLDIPKHKIGMIGNGKKIIGQKITVGIVNSIYPVADDIKRFFGHVVVDECHRCPSRTFTEAVTAFDPKYMLGLSATPWRRDGLTKLISWHLGPQVKVEQSDLTDDDIILNVEVVTKETGFTSCRDASGDYTATLSELTQDPQRNGLLVKDVIKEVTDGGGTCLVLSDRKTHCETLGNMLRDKGIEADVLTGATPEKERGAIVDRLNTGSVKVLIATGQLVGEGFDARSLQTLFLATPVKFDGRLLQYLGRVLRPAPGKDKAKVYDYVDVNVGVLTASARSRRKIYRQWQ